jgi:uncharacterized membrane protein YidH (DUF202 family)
MWNPLRAGEDEESPTGRQVAILVFGGFALAFVGFSGLWMTLNDDARVSKPLRITCTILLWVGAVLLVAGTCWLLALIAKKFSSR